MDDNGVSMRIQLNGEPRDVPDQCKLADLLQDLDVAVARVAVEVNEEIVPRTDHARCRIQAGDDIEITTLAGGG